MKKKTKILIAVMSFLMVLIVIGAILLMGNKDEVIDDNNESENTEVFDELKENLGNGSNGDITKVEEGKDEEGNRTYTLYRKDGQTSTVTVRKVTDEESNITIDIDEEDDEEPSSPPIKEPELGTVYEQYLNMSDKDREAFYYSFEDPADFFAWFNDAKKEYEALYPTIYVGEDEVLDFGK